MPSEEEIEQYYTENPQAIDPKFNGDPKKAAESYKALEAALTKTRQELAEAKKQVTAVPEQSKTVQPEGLSRNGPSESASTVDVTGGLTIPDPPKVDIWSEVEKDLKSTGDISEDTRAKLKQNGVPEHLITGFREAATFAKQQRISQAAKFLGSQAELDATIKFAQSLPEHERREINKALDSEAWQTTLMGLQARRLATNEPTRNIGVAPNSAADPNRLVFKKADDLVRAIANPRYRSDMDYAEAVKRASDEFYGKKPKR